MLIQNRERKILGNKKAIVIFPTSDWNGAFESTLPITQLIQNGYTVYYYEASTEYDAYSALNNEKLPASKAPRNTFCYNSYSHKEFGI